MKMNLYIKTVLSKSFSEYFFEGAFVHAKFEIDDRLTGYDGHNISKKSHS